MIDPILNFLNALWLIFQRLPSPFVSLVAVVATFAVVVIVIKIVRSL
jgi:hypothetical protein